jgi:hypothetical protein
MNIAYDIVASLENVDVSISAKNAAADIVLKIQSGIWPTRALIDSVIKERVTDRSDTSKALTNVAVTAEFMRAKHVANMLLNGGKEEDPPKSVETSLPDFRAEYSESKVDPWGRLIEGTYTAGVR